MPSIKRMAHNNVKHVHSSCRMAEYVVKSAARRRFIHVCTYYCFRFSSVMHPRGRAQAHNASQEFFKYNTAWCSPTLLVSNRTTQHGVQRRCLCLTVQRLRCLGGSNPRCLRMSWMRACMASVGCCSVDHIGLA